MSSCCTCAPTLTGGDRLFGPRSGLSPPSPRLSLHGPSHQVVLAHPPGYLGGDRFCGSAPLWTITAWSTSSMLYLRTHLDSSRTLRCEAMVGFSVAFVDALLSRLCHARRGWLHRHLCGRVLCRTFLCEVVVGFTIAVEDEPLFCALSWEARSASPSPLWTSSLPHIVVRGSGRLHRRPCGRTFFCAWPCEASLASASPLWTSSLPHLAVRGHGHLHCHRCGHAVCPCHEVALPMSRI